MSLFLMKEMRRVENFRKRKKNTFPYFLGSTPSLLLMHQEQIGKSVSSVALRNPWQSYIK